MQYLPTWWDGGVNRANLDELIDEWMLATTCGLGLLSVLDDGQTLLTQQSFLATSGGTRISDRGVSDISKLRQLSTRSSWPSVKLLANWSIVILHVCCFCTSITSSTKPGPRPWQIWRWQGKESWIFTGYQLTI